MTVESAKSIMADYIKEGASKVVLGGGEPSIHPDFISIIRAARQAGFSSVEVKTNGIRFCYPEFAKESVSAGADSFSVSIWGHDPPTHDWMAGRTGVFEMTEMGVKHLLHYGAEVKIDFLMSSVTVGREAGLIEDFCGIGIKRFDMWLFSIFGAGGQGVDMVPSMTDAGAAAAVAADAADVFQAKAMTTHVPPCMLGGRPEMYYGVASLGLMIVMPDGRAFRAEDSPFESGRHIEACSQCAFNDRCPGPRIEYVEHFGESEFYPICGGHF
jgi:MoaA/NifB/PqqE/SkfB family radical SAM enzyme